MRERGGEKEKTLGLGSMVQRWPGAYNYLLLALHGRADQKLMECFIRVYMSNEYLSPPSPHLVIIRAGDVNTIVILNTRFFLFPVISPT